MCCRIVVDEENRGTLAARLLISSGHIEFQVSEGFGNKVFGFKFSLIQIKL